MKNLFLYIALLFVLFTTTITHAQTAPLFACPSSQPYVRNIWEMQTWNDELLIGCGDSSNSPTDLSRNALTRFLIASPLVVYKNGVITPILTITEEQVSHIRFINGVPFIPGEDAVDAPAVPDNQWDFSNLYRWLPNGTFEKLRTVQSSIRTSDVVPCGKYLCAAISGELTSYTPPENGSPFPSGGTISTFAWSTNSGETWRETPIPADGILVWPDTTLVYCPVTNYVPSRAWTVFNFNGETYVTFNGMKTTNCTDPTHPIAQRFTLAKWSPVTGLFSFLTTTLTSDRIEREVEFGGHLVGLNSDSCNDNEWCNPRLFIADIGWNISYPNVSNCLKPEDIKVIGATLYLLCNQPTGVNQRVSIQSTTDLGTWTEVVSITEPTFGRSFAQLNGNWWIGLGIDLGASVTAKSASGQLIKVN